MKGGVYRMLTLFFDDTQSYCGFCCRNRTKQNVRPCLRARDGHEQPIMNKKAYGSSDAAFTVRMSSVSPSYTHLRGAVKV